VANNLAWLQLKGLGQPETALRTAAPLRAKEDAPDLPPAMLETLGAVYLEVGQEEKAARFLERAVRAPDPRPGYWTHLALAHLRLGRRDEARRCLDRAAALSKSPREAEEWNRVDRQWHGRPG
jgi:Flp pilus assembly protein TadD